MLGRSVPSENDALEPELHTKPVLWGTNICRDHNPSVKHSGTCSPLPTPALSGILSYVPREQVKK
jgi:hypothetical protein